MHQSAAIDPVVLPYVDALPDTPPAPLVARQRWWVVALGYLGLALVLAGFGATIWHFFSPAIVHPDANGYWGQAGTFLQTGHFWLKPASDAQFLGMHWLYVPDKAHYVMRYPVGLPMVIALLDVTVGVAGSLWLNPVLSVLTIIFTFLITKRLTNHYGFAVVAATLLAINGAFATHALIDISHTSVAFLLMAGTWCLLEWRAREKWIFAVLAGLLFGCIPTVRYPEALMAVGVIAFMVWTAIQRPKLWKHVGFACIAVMVVIVPMLIRNKLVVGGFLETGYTLTNEDTGFKWDDFKAHAMPYLWMLQSGGLGMVFGLGLLGLVAMLCTRGVRAAGLMLTLVTIPMLLLYMSYYWAQGVGASENSGGMRFLVPIVPPLIVAGVFAMATLLRNAPRSMAVVAPVGLIAMQLLLTGQGTWNTFEQGYRQKAPLAAATKLVSQYAKDGDVILGSGGMMGGLQQQLDITGKWKLADGSLTNLNEERGGRAGAAINWLGGGGGGRNPRDPNAPSPQQTLKSEERKKLYSDPDLVDRQAKFRNDILAWAGSGSIYVVGNENNLVSLVPGIKRQQLEIVGRIESPLKVQEERDDRDGMFGGPPGMGPGGGPPGGPGGGAPDNGGGPGGADPQRDRGNQGRGQQGNRGGGGGGGGRRGGGLAVGEDIVIAKVNFNAVPVEQTPVPAEDAPR